MKTTTAVMLCMLKYTIRFTRKTFPKINKLRALSKICLRSVKTRYTILLIRI